MTAACVELRHGIIAIAVTYFGSHGRAPTTSATIAHHCVIKATYASVRTAGHHASSSCNCSRSRSCLLVMQEFSQASYAWSGENAEDVTLVIVKLRRRFTAES